MARGENKEQNEIVAHMKNFETVSNSDIKFDESFNIKIDCNNDIGIMYMRSQDKICYLKNKDKAYQLSKEDYDFIINKVEEKKKKRHRVNQLRLALCFFVKINYLTVID